MVLSLISIWVSDDDLLDPLLLSSVMGFDPISSCIGPDPAVLSERWALVALFEKTLELQLSQVFSWSFPICYYFICSSMNYCIIMVYRLSSLLVVFMAAAISIASEDKEIYVVHMDKAKTTALDNILGDSKKWYEVVMDSITELSAEEDGGEEASAPELLYTYETAITGFAARLSNRQLEALNKVDGFLSAVPDEMLSLQTTHSPQFLGLKFGEGLLTSRNLANDVIIGFVDSGIWPEHASFKDGGMKRPVPSRWKGVCEEGTRFTAKNCNMKLIGARAYYKGYEAAAGKIDETVDFRSARDSQGHGTHTASTAAGQMIDGASLFGMAKGVAAGMSSTARIAEYKACYSRGCASSDILAAIDQAVSDGLMSFQHGVFVAAAAGNSGPSSSTVVNAAPWMMTVAASTMDRSFPAIVNLGRAIAKYCSSGTLSPALVKGKIVVCERGINGGVEKGQEVEKAGGAGMLLLNTASQARGIPLLPLFSKGQCSASPAPVMASFSSRGPALKEPYVIKPDVTAPGVNILAAWPPTVSPSKIKSDNRSVLFNVISGTSMSCPHVGGLAAILKEAHKEWSPAAIKSALMTTAYTLDNKKAPISDMRPNSPSATPFAYGSGHVDPEKASKPGLIYDITYVDYLYYLCSLNYSSSQMATISRGNFSCPTYTVLQTGDLNYPSFAVLFKRNSENNSAICKRTVTNVGYPRTAYVAQVHEPEGVPIIVKPKVLKFRRAGQKLSYEVRFADSGKKSNSSDPSFGSLVWVSIKYTVRSPIAVTWK
ncbi:Subtilisin-like protease SBT1.1 [Vitis vinifera]|uniref:Subtilisin-like protease SBT1.1 n=1 Tax=Vitis vinifera TaxID=29760 RepID=A0A438E038_VITVI|nr:Subtilisin-like protease SBT1.1 [Vitis vinifera]